MSAADLYDALDLSKRAWRIRIGPLRRADLSAQDTLPLLQLHAGGWRIARSGCCLECALLWEIQSDRSPSNAGSLASRKPGRAAIAINPDSLKLLRTTLRAATFKERRWTTARYLNSVRYERQPAAVGCSRCASTIITSLQKHQEPPEATAYAVIKALGVRHRERSLHPRGKTRLPVVKVDWAIAHRRADRPDEFIGSGSSQLGVGRNIRERLLTGRAEVIERASAMLREPDIKATPSRQLKHNYLPLEQWSLYTDEQYASESFPFRPVDADTPIDWIWATDLASAERLLVPAAFTMTARLSTPRFVSSSSNGVATHTSTEAAIRSAMLEVLERDALQIAWYCGAAIHPLSTDQIDIPREFAAPLRRGGWKLNFAWIEGRAGVYVVVVIAEMQATQGRLPQGAALLCSAAAGQIESALLRATREVVMATEVVTLRSEVPMDFRLLRQPPQLSSYWDAPSLPDIALLYLNPLMRPAVSAFLRGTPGKLPKPQMADDASSLLKRIKRQGLRALSIDLSLVRSNPFVTYQVVVIGAQPLAFGTGVLRLGSGLLPRKLPSRSPPLPAPGFQVVSGTLNPYILPLA